MPLKDVQAAGARGVGGLHTSADAGKRGSPPKPAQQRRPVVTGAFGGKNAQCVDVGAHVPATPKGSGTRRAVSPEEFGEPLIDLNQESGQVWLGIVRPLAMRYGGFDAPRVGST